VQYEVFPDGREELVRNAKLKGLNESSFKDLVAASAAETVYTMPFFDIGSTAGECFPALPFPATPNHPS
jgi:hypothetical protein